MERRSKAVVIGPSATLRRELCSIIERRGIEIVGSYKTVKEAQSDVVPELILLCSATEGYQRELRSCKKRWPEVQLMHISRLGKAEYQLTGGGVDGYADLRLPESDLVTGIRLISSFGCTAALFASQARKKAHRLGDPLGQIARSNERESSPRAPEPGERASIGTGKPDRIVAGLSAHELEILDAVALGWRNKAIAKSCGLSEAAVNTKLKRIMQKLGVSNRTQAALWRLEMRSSARR